MTYQNAPGPTHRSDGGRAHEDDRLGGAITSQISKNLSPSQRLRLHELARRLLMLGLGPDHLLGVLFEIEAGADVRDVLERVGRIELRRALDRRRS
jgi:hypothetical protein